MEGEGKGEKESRNGPLDGRAGRKGGGKRASRAEVGTDGGQDEDGEAETRKGKVEGKVDKPAQVLQRGCGCGFEGRKVCRSWGNATIRRSTGANPTRGQDTKQRMQALTSRRMLLTLIHPILVHDRGRCVDALAVDRVKAEEGVVLLAPVEVAVGALDE
jgi:hypothetical protein